MSEHGVCVLQDIYVQNDDVWSYSDMAKIASYIVHETILSSNYPRTVDIAVQMIHKCMVIMR